MHSLWVLVLDREVFSVQQFLSVSALFDAEYSAKDRVGTRSSNHGDVSANDMKAFSVLGTVNDAYDNTVGLPIRCCKRERERARKRC